MVVAAENQGDIMAITFELVERTPNRLRYLATSDGASTTSTDAGTLPNAGGPSPDLQTDAARWNDQPIDRLVSTPVASQEAAERLMQGNGLISADSVHTLRGRVYVQPRQVSVSASMWALRANAVAGFAVLEVLGPNGKGDCAYIDIVA